MDEEMERRKNIRRKWINYCYREGWGETERKSWEMKA